MSRACISFFVVAIFAAGCSHLRLDKQRHDELTRVIENSPSNMVDIPLTNAVRLLSLEGVPFDEGYDNYPLGEWRFYHFRGFYLALHLHLLPPGVTPTTPEFSIGSDIRETG